MIPLVREITPVCDIARQHHGKLPLAVVSSGEISLPSASPSHPDAQDLGRWLPKDVQRHKPHPDPFLTAARSLGIPPEKCRCVRGSVGRKLNELTGDTRVYEDADAGVEAAVRAGMSVVDVRKIPGVMASLELAAAAVVKLPGECWGAEGGEERRGSYSQLGCDSPLSCLKVKESVCDPTTRRVKNQRREEGNLNCPGENSSA
eukprot:759549-Hanusia_phi.AAC.1